MMGVQGVMSRISELKTQLGIAPATPNATFATALSDATSTKAATSGVTGQSVVDAAKKYLGTPYAFGSTNAAKGLDCSALVQKAYQDLGIDLPRTSREQAKAGTKVDSLRDARPGDILA